MGDYTREFLNIFWRAFLALTITGIILFGVPYLAYCLFGDIVALIITILVIFGFISALVSFVVME